MSVFDERRTDESLGKKMDIKLMLWSIRVSSKICQCSREAQKTRGILPNPLCLLYLLDSLAVSYLPIRTGLILKVWLFWTVFVIFTGRPCHSVFTFLKGATWLCSFAQLELLPPPLRDLCLNQAV